MVTSKDTRLEGVSKKPVRKETTEGRKESKETGENDGPSKLVLYRGQHHTHLPLLAILTCPVVMCEVWISRFHSHTGPISTVVPSMKKQV